MVEPADAKDLIDEAIERAEAARDTDEGHERDAERRFRNRVSVMVGVIAVTLAIVHMAAASAARESLLEGIEASDTFAYMQAKIVRETVLKTASGFPSPQSAKWQAEAKRLRQADTARHGIGQLQAQGEESRSASNAAAEAGESYELGETALQMAIVLLSIALIARSRAIVIGAGALAALGAVVAIMTAAGAQYPDVRAAMRRTRVGNALIHIATIWPRHGDIFATARDHRLHDARHDMTLGRRSDDQRTRTGGSAAKLDVGAYRLRGDVARRIAYAGLRAVQLTLADLSAPGAARCTQRVMEDAACVIHPPAASIRETGATG